jgi:hypothetical protein
MYEHRSRPLLPRIAFYSRLARHVAFALAMLGLALGIGVLGYRWTEEMPWIDALLNASMILGGMGPVGDLKTNAGKLFASGYALFSGVFFLAFAAILMAPIAHRFLHKLHLSLKDER